ncbi:MAG: TonB-dependent receptor [Campylobacterales bacterium]|nr:TonB-dependent receptor [Campylobacterales bacterium]
MTAKRMLPIAVIAATHLMALANAQEGTELGSVSVISQKESLANNVVSSDNIAQMTPMTDAMNMINRLPGVNVQQGDAFGFDDWTTQMTMRGFDTDQIGFIIDGVPNGQTNYGGGAKPNRFLETENLEAISVTQGSADISSTSNQALGGTINYSTGMPTKEERIKVSRTQGSNNMERTFVRYDTGLFNNDQTSAFVSFSDTFANRWIGTGSNGKFERTHIEGKIKHTWDANMITLRASYNDRYENDYDSVSLEEFETNPTTDRLTWFWTGNPAYDQNFAETWAGKRKDTMVSATGDFMLPAELRLVAVPYYHHQRGEGHWMPPYIITFNPDGSTNKVYTDEETGAYTASHRTSHYENNRFGTTLRIEKELENHLLAAGMWYEFQNRDNWRSWYHVLDEATHWAWDDTPYWKQYDYNYETTTTMFYLEDKMHFMNDALQVNVGLKIHNVETDLSDEMNGGSWTQKSESELLPQIGLVYNVDANHQLFTSYSQGFSAKPDYLLGEDFKDPDLKPEKSDNFDLGYRYKDNALAITSALYYTIYRDRIGSRDLTADDTGDIFFDESLTGYFNIGGIESYGLELGATYQITPTLNVYASYTYNNSEYSESNPAEGIVEGNKVVAQAENMAAIDLTYTRNGYLLGINAKYTGERYSKLDNSEKAPDYTLVGLVAGYNKNLKDSFIKNLNAQVNVYNLTDEEYLASVWNPGSYYLGAPRNVTFTLGGSF